MKEGMLVKVKYDAKDLVGRIVLDSGQRLVLCEFPDMPLIWLSRNGLEEATYGRQTQEASV